MLNPYLCLTKQVRSQQVVQGLGGSVTGVRWQLNGTGGEQRGVIHAQKEGSAELACAITYPYSSLESFSDFCCDLSAANLSSSIIQADAQHRIWGQTQ